VLAATCVDVVSYDRRLVETARALGLPTTSPAR
jgi:hypothetical protein